MRVRKEEGQTGRLSGAIQLLIMTEQHQMHHSLSVRMYVCVCGGGELSVIIQDTPVVQLCWPCAHWQSTSPWTSPFPPLSLPLCFAPSRSYCVSSTLSSPHQPPAVLFCCSHPHPPTLTLTLPIPPTTRSTLPRRLSASTRRCMLSHGSPLTSSWGRWQSTWRHQSALRQRRTHVGVVFGALLPLLTAIGRAAIGFIHTVRICGSLCSSAVHNLRAIHLSLQPSSSHPVHAYTRIHTHYHPPTPPFHHQPPSLPPSTTLTTTQSTWACPMSQMIRRSTWVPACCAQPCLSGPTASAGCTCLVHRCLGWMTRSTSTCRTSTQTCRLLVRVCMCI